jgi:hypothetical protein
MDHYQEPGMSDNNYEQMPVIQPPQQSQTMMAYETPSHTSPSIHEEINSQEHQSPQMPVHDAMSNLHLDNQIPSTSGGIVSPSGGIIDSPSGAISDSPSGGRVTRARTRGLYT